jgi:Ni/Co efflux regulator RcnB
MKFKVDHTAGSGTSLMGYLENTTLESLIKSFGEPQRWDEGDKVTTEWTILFDDGVVATVYDWKRYDLGAPAMTELYDWHIGGNCTDAVDRVVSVLSQKSMV